MTAFYIILSTLAAMIIGVMLFILVSFYAAKRQMIKAEEKQIQTYAQEYKTQFGGSIENAEWIVRNAKPKK